MTTTRSHGGIDAMLKRDTHAARATQESSRHEDKKATARRRIGKEGQ